MASASRKTPRMLVREHPLLPLVEGGTPHREALSIPQSRYVAAMDLAFALPAKRLTATFSLAPACVQPSSTASPTADTSWKRAPTPTASPTAGPNVASAVVGSGG